MAEMEKIVKLRLAELRKANRKLRMEIVERKRAEDDLRKQKEILQKIFDHVPVMIRFWTRMGAPSLSIGSGSTR